jgi:pyruvate kinase
MPPFTRTKIVATLGPASDDAESIAKLVEAGADVFRINMSHAQPDAARALVQRVRSVSTEVGILIDTKGPELRTTEVDQPVVLPAGQRVKLSGASGKTTAAEIKCGYPALTQHLEPGVRVYVDDGQIRLLVEEVGPKRRWVRCLIERGATIGSRRGVNVPGVNVFPRDMTAQDAAAVRLAGEVGADFLAASFVQTAADVVRIKGMLGEMDATAAVIAKIETRQAVDNITEILSVSHGIMVARGDLGVEIPAEEVPLVQKALVSQCNAAAKPVIVATQMLESMIDSAVPTRAETSDVANAVLDGADAIMLSGETAKGRFAVEAVQTMVRVTNHIEQRVDLLNKDLWAMPAETTASFVSKAVFRAVRDLKADVVVTMTRSGKTARLVARYKPGATIMAATPNRKVARQLMLSYGVQPVVVPRAREFTKVLHDTLSYLLENDYVQRDDRAVVAFGLTMHRSGSTNFLGCDTVDNLLSGVTRVTD